MRGMQIQEIETVTGGLTYALQPLAHGSLVTAQNPAEMVYGLCRHLGIHVSLGDCNKLVAKPTDTEG